MAKIGESAGQGDRIATVLQHDANAVVICFFSMYTGGTMWPRPCPMRNFQASGHIGTGSALCGAARLVDGSHHEARMTENEIKAAMWCHIKTLGLEPLFERLTRKASPVHRCRLGIQSEPHPREDGAGHRRSQGAFRPPIRDPLPWASGLEPPFRDNSFSFVLSSKLIEYVSKDPWMLDELYRVLKPGGRLQHSARLTVHGAGVRVYRESIRKTSSRRLPRLTYFPLHRR